MKEFQFADELRNWILSVLPVGEVWVRWATRTFRVYIRSGFWVASDSVSGATRVL